MSERKRSVNKLGGPEFVVARVACLGGPAQEREVGAGGTDLAGEGCTEQVRWHLWRNLLSLLLCLFGLSPGHGTLEFELKRLVTRFKVRRIGRQVVRAF